MIGTAAFKNFSSPFPKWRHYRVALSSPVVVVVVVTQVRQSDAERYVPALTRYKTVRSAGMLDITNKNCGPWLQRQLIDLVDKYQFDAFYLDMGTWPDLK